MQMIAPAIERLLRAGEWLAAKPPSAETRAV
jgi:hypothetical protein